MENQKFTFGDIVVISVIILIVLEVSGIIDSFIY